MASPLTAAIFAALMAPLGPFESRPRLGIAVSGGADSMALALLAARWAADRGGSVLALTVDHGLRPNAPAEAALTQKRLLARGIACRILELRTLAPGSALAERARAARYAALRQACREAGVLHLLLGHHAADQAETVLMRTLSQSGPAGLAGMAALVEEAQLRLLRPLLRVAPVTLRATLAAAGVAWVEDPSNTDPRATRARLRGLRRDPDGTGPATSALALAAWERGQRRAEAETAIAQALASDVTLYPGGFAVIAPGALPSDALGALLATIAGRPHLPRTAALAALASAPRPATLAGAQLVPAGRLGPGLLVIREAAAMAKPVAAKAGAIWDGRFRLVQGPVTDSGQVLLGPLGAAAAGLRRRTRHPAVILRTLPAIWRGGELVAVPHLDWPDPDQARSWRLLFAPRRPAAINPFVAGAQPS